LQSNQSLYSGRTGHQTRRNRAHLFAFLAIGLALAIVTPAHAETSAPAADATENAEVQEIVVNGVPFHETVLPTRLPATSSLGLDLNIMDTPRSATLLSATQLQTVNVSDPRAISFFTSSSFTDSSYGTVAVPLIRTQTADIYYNGMRNSLNSGFGAPVNFDSLSNMAITKGPASVIDGPGPGVGGKVDFLTKRPDMFRDTEQASATVDSLGRRRWVLDVGAPIIKGDLAVLFSYSGEDSSSYFYNHFMHKNALYGALEWKPNDQYTLELISEINFEQATTDVGINRGNQALINSGEYLVGTVLAPGSSEPQPYLSVFNTTGVTRLNPRITMDETPGDTLRGQLFNAQLIQSYRINDNLTLQNNTLFLHVNSDTQDLYYYSDSSNGSYTIESKTSLKGNFELSLGGMTVRNQFVAGGTYRLAHTDTIGDISAEAEAVWDLSGNPNSWRLDPALQAGVDAVPYQTSLGRTMYGVPGQDYGNQGYTGVSDLYDTALFVQDRIEFTPKFSVLFGGRVDAVKAHTRDPLECLPAAYTCAAAVVPSERSSGVYGLGDANFSVVYKFTPQISSYATFDWVQSPPSPNAPVGGINVYGFVSDDKLLRGKSFLYESGLKFNLFDEKLFASMAVFDQTHAVPTGPGGVLSAAADTRGVELETNYQPNRNLFVTASYSFLRTTLASAAGFDNFPAQLGTNIDGEGTLVSFLPAKSYTLPGLPEHLFNLLGNYKFSSGVGLRTGLQVTGPIETTTSGLIDVGALINTLQSLGLPVVIPNSVTVNPQNPNVGYYKSPVIPWQYTWNAALFYEHGPYTLTFSVYNLTDRNNWQPAPAYYGNDELVRSDPRSFEIRLQAKL
jgi:iron complex outermembrane receptor protein